MTAEQRQKFSDIRKKNNDEFGQKGKELLSADQYKRFQQIHFQYLLRQTERALRAPNVASELKLTDDQNIKLRTQAGNSPKVSKFRGTNFRTTVMNTT